MNSETVDKPREELLQLRRDAEKRNYRHFVLLGFSVAPCLMGATWFLTGDVSAVKSVGVWIFIAGSILFATAYTRFLHYSDKLKSVSQHYSVTIRGVLGPIKERYRTQYDFARFHANEFEAHKKMHLWGGLCGGASFAVICWLITISFFRQFIWS